MAVLSLDARIFVAGASGMVGSALVRRLRGGGYTQLLTPTRAALDLLDQRAVFDWLAAQRPQYLFIAAARVGGIAANQAQPADFAYDNLQIEANLIRGAHRAGVQRLMFLGSSCIYPRDCPQPMREEHLLSGALEPSNRAYAVAKIAGIELADAHNRQHGRRYLSVMPTNLYGPGDHYDLATSHVLPALLRKAHEAHQRGHGELVVWGSGTPRREFLHVDDLADACVHLMQIDHPGPLVNIGCGEDLTIRELAETVMQVVGFSGRIVFDASRPDGAPRKLLDIARLAATGWRARIGLREGIADAFADFLRRGVGGDGG